MREYKVNPGDKIELNSWDPNEISGPIKQKSDAKNRLDELNDQLEELQELLYAEHKRKLLH